MCVTDTICCPAPTFTGVPDTTTDVFLALDAISGVAWNNLAPTQVAAAFRAAHRCTAHRATIETVGTVLAVEGRATVLSVDMVDGTVEKVTLTTDGQVRMQGRVAGSATRYDHEGALGCPEAVRALLCAVIGVLGAPHVADSDAAA